MFSSKLKRRFSDIIRKNKDEGLSLLLFSLPFFVYRNSDYLPENNIPVFSFHSVKAELFEKQLKYLSDNNYNTLNSDSLIDIISGNKKGSRNSVVLTFDDGRKSLWTTAYPLLKKYKYTAISFIVPSIIKDNEIKSATLEDYWSGKTSLGEIENIENEIPLSNWNEIKEMHESGVVDFQSHSMYHASVFTDNKLIDFINPDFVPTLLDSTLNPLGYIKDDKFSVPKIEYGSPIYKWDSQLISKTRYIPEEKINESCIEYVQLNGGASFFDNPDWRNELKLYFSGMKKKYGQGAFQNYEERITEIKKDLADSRKVVEEILKKQITHLCLPWYLGNKLTVQLAKESGYECIYWGIKNRKSTNYVGDDPFFIKRINDYFIFSLPGKNRISLNSQIINKIKKRY